jgi:hypothetical protein
MQQTGTSKRQTMKVGKYANADLNKARLNKKMSTLGEKTEK